MRRPSSSQGRSVRTRKRRRRYIHFDVSTITSSQNVEQVDHFPTAKAGKLSTSSSDAAAGLPGAGVRNLETSRKSQTVDVNADPGTSGQSIASPHARNTEFNDSDQREQGLTPNYSPLQQLPSEGNISIGREVSDHNESGREMVEETRGNETGRARINELVGGPDNDEQNEEPICAASATREIRSETLIGIREIDDDVRIASGASSRLNQTEGESNSSEPSDESTEHESASTEGLEAPVGRGNRAVTSSGRDVQAATFNHWQKLLPCLLINGTIRFTRDQYANVIALCNFFNQHICCSWRTGKHPKQSLLDDPSPLHSVFPSFRTLQRSIRELLLSKLVARGSNAWHNVDPTKAGAQTRAFMTDSGNANSTRSDTPSGAAAGKTKVTVVPISEYARLDLACAPVFRAMISTSLSCRNGDVSNTNNVERERVTSGVRASECIDEVPLISDRPGFYGNSAPVGVDPPDAGSNIKARQVEVGDTIRIDSMPSFDLNEALLAEFSHLNSSPAGDQQILENPNDIVSLSGIVVATWSAMRSFENQGDRRVQKNLSDAEAKVMQFFRFSPDSTSNLSWSLCRPGDSFTLLRAPAPVTNDNPHYLVLIHRFLIEGGENSYSVVWVRVQLSPQESAVDVETDLGSVLIENSSSDTRLNSPRCEFIPAFRVTVLKEVEGARGSAASDPIPSMGFLADGTRYFIYRFMLFWDGFRITQGKAASGTGVYMVSLNLPRKQRVGIASVRVLSLFPPGVCVQEVFARLKEDILKGMTEGFLDYDSSGTPIRIFLDFVCSVGDTPALNETIDVMGHNAAACCHLCRFIRSAPGGIKVGRHEFVPTSRYTSVDIHGSLEVARRDLARSESLSDRSVEDSIRRRLGFKTKGVDDILGLHDMCKSFEAVRSQIPKDVFGRPIIASVLDPYRSLLIGPDHVLFGVGKDCINAALQLISPSIRLMYEKFAITAMKDCRIRTQNKLLDRDSGKLLSMGMSDLYCVLFISEYAFCKAVLEHQIIGGSSPSARGQERELTPISKRARKAILVVASFSRIVSKLCYWPYAHIDGKNSVKAFNEELGLARIRNLQDNVKSFLRSVNELCSFDESVPRRLEAVGRARGMSRAQKDREKRALISDMKEANLARTQLDHPNLHRLLELTETVLPAVGHITRISELLFEKAHQEMKRAIRQSNMRNPQLDAVNSALINDWQGRLTMLHRDLGSEQEDTRKEAQIGIFRLLMGREELFARGGVLSTKDIEMITNAIGPKGTVDAALEREGRQVITGEIYSDENVLKWRLLRTNYGEEMTSCLEYERNGATGQRAVPESEAGPQHLTRNERYGIERLQSNQVHSQHGTDFCVEVIETLRKRAVDFLTSMYGRENFKHGYEVRPLHCNNSLYPDSYGVRAGDVIQALTVRESCRNGPFSFVETIENGSHGAEEKVTYWFTLSFYEVETGCGALVLPCELDDSYSEFLNSDALQPSNTLSIEPALPVYCVAYRPGTFPKILLLGSSCRRVGVMHDCRGHCKRDEKELFVRHKDHVFKSRFYLVDRKAGFPPRTL